MSLAVAEPAGLKAFPTEFPKLSPACSFHVYDGGRGREEYVLGVDGRHFRISALARRILERFDGKTSLQEIAAVLQRESIAITADELRLLVEQRYSHLGVLEGEGQPAAPAIPRGVRPTGFPFLLTWDLVPPGIVCWFARGLAWLYSRPTAVLCLALTLLAHLAVYSPRVAARIDSSFSPEQGLAIMALCILSILIHELGHAAAVHRFGGTPGTIGFGLYLLMPTFYADVSQIWRFSRRRRMLVDLGGVYFQQICFAAFAILGLTTHRSELLAACQVIDFMVLVTLNPIFRFDGYWFLVDYLAIPRLQGLALRYPVYLLRRLAGRPAELPDVPPLGRVETIVFRSYAVLSGLFLICVVGLAYRSLSSAMSGIPVLLPALLKTVRTAVDEGNVLAVIDRALVLFLLFAFPASALLGMAIYLRSACLWCAAKLRGALDRRAELPRRRKT
jgi:putative peptide zinc metalloprotease protein